jgi:hypothetical protein
MAISYQVGRTDRLKTLRISEGTYIVSGSIIWCNTIESDLPISIKTCNTGAPMTTVIQLLYGYIREISNRS